jgi:Spy/CpxP family protein refolding chaperone
MLAFTVFFSSLTFAQENKEKTKMPKNMGMMCSMMKGHKGMYKNVPALLLKYQKQLNLTEGQVKKIKEIKQNMKKTNKERGKKLKKEFKELRKLENQDKVNIDAIREKIKKIYLLKAELRIDSLKAQESAKSVLNEKQREQLKGINIAMKDMMHSKKKMKMKKMMKNCMNMKMMQIHSPKKGKKKGK